MFLFEIWWHSGVEWFRLVFFCCLFFTVAWLSNRRPRRLRSIISSENSKMERKKKKNENKIIRSRSSGDDRFSLGQRGRGWAYWVFTEFLLKCVWFRLVLEMVWRFSVVFHWVFTEFYLVLHRFYSSLGHCWDNGTLLYPILLFIYRVCRVLLGFTGCCEALPSFDGLVSDWHSLKSFYWFILNFD